MCSGGSESSYTAQFNVCMWKVAFRKSYTKYRAQAPFDKGDAESEKWTVKKDEPYKRYRILKREVDVKDTELWKEELR